MLINHIIFQKTYFRYLNLILFAIVLFLNPERLVAVEGPINKVASAQFKKSLNVVNNYRDRRGKGDQKSYLIAQKQSQSGQYSPAPNLKPNSRQSSPAPNLRPNRNHKPHLPTGGIKLIIDLSNTTKPGKKPPKKSTRKKAKPKTKVTRRKKKVRKTRTAIPRRPSPVVGLPTRRDREIVVLLDDAQPQSLASELAQTYQLELLGRFDSVVLSASLQRYRVSGTTRSVEDAINSLRADNRVAFAHFNSIYYAQQQKPQFSSSTTQYALQKIRLNSAHAISKGNDVLIAVIDTGIDISHPDLVDNISSSFNAVQDSEYRAHSHGTAIAGIISASGKVKGVAPMAKLLAVRTFFVAHENAIPQTSSFILMRGLDWAFTNGGRIFNLSFAGPHDPIVKKLLFKIYKKGGILVAAAGNGGAKAAPAYPAAYRNVLAITAIDQTDRLYAKANQGHYISVSAPGVDVLVTSPNKRYRFSSGTSIAAAHVSGLIALMRGHSPDISGKEISKLVTSTAIDLGPKGHDRKFGSGRMDAEASMQALIKMARKMK